MIHNRQEPCSSGPYSGSMIDSLYFSPSREADHRNSKSFSVKNRFHKCVFCIPLGTHTKQMFLLLGQPQQRCCSNLAREWAGPLSGPFKYPQFLDRLTHSVQQAGINHVSLLEIHDQNQES